LTLFENGHSIISVAAESLPFPMQRAVDFAKRFHIPSVYASYHELATDPSVDIVYIAVTNNLHYPVALLMLSSGKHVLCEKPTTLNANHTRHLVETAERNGLFFSANYWTRFFPVFRKVKMWVRNGAIGDVLSLRADAGFQCVPHEHDTNKYFDRFWRKELGGGAMLDMGLT